MPVLSVYFGSTFVSSLALNPDGEFHTFRFPYSYNGRNFSHFCDPEAFYAEVLNLIIKKLRLKKSELEIVATGISEIPRAGVDYKHTLTLDKILASQLEYAYFAVDGWSVFSHAGANSIDLLTSQEIEEADRDYLANLGIYTNARPTSDNFFEFYLDQIKQLLQSPSGDQSIIDRPILLSADFIFGHNRARGYLFLLELLTMPGVFEMAIDRENTYMHLQLIKSYNPELVANLQKPDTIFLGTLINSPGESSFLLKDEVNTSRLVELPEGKLFLSPLEKEQKLTAVIKNATLGSTEKIVSGGRVGLIIDTRVKQDPAKFNSSINKVSLAQHLQIIKENTSQI